MKDKRFCVYFHKNSNTGEIFYIGKGNSKRPYLTYNRGKKWHQYLSANNCNFEVEIYKDGLSSTQALALEEDLIKSGKYSSIINTIINCVVKSNIYDVAFENVYYDETSSTFLRWKTDRKNNLYKAGEEAGSIDDEGYGVVTINSSPYRIHRLVWTLHNGEIPDGFIVDHIDSNKSNNAIGNLAAITQKENIRKAKYQSEYPGITYRVNAKLWEATWCENLKQKTKGFSEGRYGNLAKQMAIDYRNVMWNIEHDPEKYKELLSEFEDKYKDLLGRRFPVGVSIQNDSKTGFDYFRATWKAGNLGTKFKGFSINKYGYDEAYRLACEWRKQMEELYYK